MKILKKLLLLILITSAKNSLSQAGVTFPITGTTTFANATNTTMATSGPCVPSKTTAVSGWSMSVSSSSNCAIIWVGATTGTDGHINMNATPGGFQWLGASFGSFDGSEFKLENINIATTSVPMTGFAYIFTGYKNGTPVAGASYTSAILSTTGVSSGISVTFTSNTAFNNIDEFKITSANSSAQGNFFVLDITVGNAIAACPTPSLNLSSQTNVSCYGSSNGSATVFSSGGTSFTYTWFPSGGNSATATGLSAGSYTCVTTNSCGLTASVNVTITQPSVLSLTPLSQTNISCNAGSNGAAIVNAATGGAGGYTYNWTPGNPAGDGTTSVTGLIAGTWSCTVTDANSCTKTQTFNITQPTAINVSPLSQNNISCFGGSNGAAQVSASGGAGSYTYNWTPGNPTGDGTTSVTGLIAGTWSCTITDANSCTRTQTFNITQPTALSLTPASQTNISCNGGSNGAASVNAATGGSGGYTYNWTPGNPTGDGTTSVTGLTAGSWTCTVTDANACSSSTTFNVTQPTAISLTPASQTNISCNGGSNGAASVNTATGGAGGYTYNWTPGNPTGDGTTAVTGLTAGSWTCAVTDANACTRTQTFNITQPSQISISSTQTNVTCNAGSDGVISITASGGNGAYSYLWSPSVSSSSVASGLPSGNYTCTVTDANSCAITQTFSLTQPNPITSIIDFQANVTCFGGSDGSVHIFSGGAGMFSYTWLPYGGNNSPTASGLIAGTYTCIITDMNSCSKTQTVTITQPTQITATIGSNPTSCTGNTGSAIITSPAGGAGGYTYSWAPTGGTAATATALGVGSYTCTITDANSCSITKTVSVITASGPSLTSLAQTNVACFGNSTGAASVNNATGGAGGYTYNWTPGNPTGDGTTSVTGLTAGSWSCTVTDANGCSAFQAFNITQPVSPLATATAVTNVLCFGNSTGSATVTASGGTSAYSYLWLTGATTSVITSQTSGVKTVTVTDANGCTSVKSVSISQPASALATTTAVTNVACFGNSTGAATVTATGGTSSYTYLWSTGATTSVITSQASGTKSYTVTDANGCSSTGNVIISQPASALATSTTVSNVLCNGGSTGSATVTATGGTSAYSYLWSTGATTSVITSQTSGVKTVTVTDANGCTSIKSVSISQPASALATSTAVTNVACFGNSTGSATVTATGGTSAYTYLWSTGATTSVITSQSSGTKSYTVTEANGCTNSGNVIISQPASALATSTTVSNVLCNGGSTGSATVTTTGGTSAYTYLWSTGATTSVISSQTSGVKTVTVTDANGCTSVNSVNISQPTLLSATSSQTNTTCNGVCNGAANVSVSGGTSPYTYNWSNGSTTASQNGLCAGSYSVTITDANGCQVIQTITITEPTAIAITTTSGNILCNGGSTNVTVTANGGTGAFTGTGIFTQTAGTYTYTVSDANACSNSTVITITEPSVLTVNLSAAPIACNGSTTQVNIVANGGTSPYTGTAPVIVSAGSYSYTVTDNNGCVVTETISISEPAAIVASQTITICNGQSLTIGANTYTASGIYVDVLPSQINGCDSTLTTDLIISPAITHTQNINLCFGETINIGANTYNTSGTYVDVLTVVNGCDSTLTTILVVNPAIDVTTNLSGLTISANESSATYQWIDCDNSNQPIAGETNQTFTASSNGNYAVIVTQNSCSDTSACVNISTVGIKDVSKANTVNIYPNPSNGIYNISGLALNSKIVVYDAIGQIIYTSITTESKETVDISKLPNGVYVIQLNSENRTTTKKVIKKD